MKTQQIRNLKASIRRHFWKRWQKPEDVAKVQNAARSKMEEKLEQQKVIEEADRFAMLSVWEIYQPMINAVTTGYSLKVEME